MRDQQLPSEKWSTVVPLGSFQGQLVPTTSWHLRRGGRRGRPAINMLYTGIGYKVDIKRGHLKGKNQYKTSMVEVMTLKTEAQKVWS